MIKTYSYQETKQAKLHEFVMAFFNRIEFETAPFSNIFFDKEFYDNIVKRHRDILRKPFHNLYDKINAWNDQVRKTVLINAIRESNRIKEICEGTVTPHRINDIDADVRAEINDIFTSLYDKVLKGEFYTPLYGTRLEHYHEFKKYKKNDLEFCPACGMVEMKTYTDDLTDQYDHYLSKTIYPLSSVNFKNLVPICKDCNSFLVKDNTDILKFTGVVFYPFNENHKEIEITLKIAKDDADDLSKITWKVAYSSPNGKKKELTAWKSIYDIPNRHYTHVTGNLKKWFGYYIDYMNDKDSVESQPNYTERKKDYLRSIKNRKRLEYLSLTEYLNSYSIKSDKEAKKYSMFND